MTRKKSRKVERSRPPAKRISYPLESTESERRRLVLQANLLRDITLDTFRAAGIGPGMRVLDIGSGAGDVALLAADLVGETGSVLGLDRDEKNLAFAKSRSREAGRRNVTFHQAEVSSFAGKQMFDAVIGRYILLYIADPVSLLRQLVATLAPGGIVAFIEPDFSIPMRSYPVAPLYQKACQLVHDVVKASNMRLESAAGLAKDFVDAGLPFPRLDCRPWIGGGPNSVLYEYVAETVRSLLPTAIEQGIVKPKEVKIDTLAARMEKESVALGSTLIGCPVISAWSKLP